MRKIALVMLVVFSSGTMAEWTKVNSDEMGAQYIDLGRMQRNGELVKIWTVIDYKEPRKMLGKIFRSVVVQEEYDCENELQRVLFVVANSGQMAAGAAVISDPQVTNWQPTPPGSSGEMFLMLACGK